jgi:hypothetical protein
MKRESETDLVRACLQFLELHRVMAWRNNSRVMPGPGKGGRERLIRFGVKGGSDIFAILKGGRFAAFECKMPKGRVSPDQERFLNEVIAAGGIGAVIRSVAELAEYVVIPKVTA